MLVFWTQRLVFLATPKTGTVALEGALAPDAAMVFRDPPEMKHMPYRVYESFLKPRLDRMGGIGLETVAVMREPLDWLGSWYRYRARPALRGHPNSTADMSFDDFVAGYLATPRPGFADVGCQSDFVADAAGQVAVDYLLPYEDPAAVTGFFARRLGRAVAPRRLNVSPEMALPLSPRLAAAFRHHAARDLRLHARVRAGEMADP